MRRPSLLLTTLALLTTACGDSTGSDRKNVANVTIDAQLNVITEGRDAAFEAVPIDGGGTVVEGLSATWRSRDPSVARIASSTGLGARVQGVGAGKTEIEAEVEGRRAVFPVEVAPAALPLWRRPFDGDFPLASPFDHDLPIHQFRGGFVTDWRGQVLNGLEGHDGYDWMMPTGTPLLAVADGRVNYAGFEPAFPCALLGNALVAALYVNVVHRSPTGERFVSLYVHLDRADVRSGDTVRAGQQIGVSGNTGCSTGPHLHFGTSREFYTRSGYRNGVGIDPSGWTGPGNDPWLTDPRGAASTRLWMQGMEPPLVRAGQLAPVPMEAVSPELLRIPSPRR